MRQKGFTQHHLLWLNRLGSLKKQTGLIKSGAGFTLVELIVVLGVTAVLGTLGIAGFTNYNQIQVLQTSANDVATMVGLARSRALSQIKTPSLCGPLETLNGYKVDIVVPKSYSIYLRCSGADRQITEETKTLGKDVSFGSSISFFFPVGGGVQTSGTITIIHFNRKIKTIMINSLGGITVQ